ncbi:hypothetical protein E4T56_gene4941 [Termitomyces sp. T112]|nr:hypothetical protein E4T56_gene4941 [Termitomyces sp. T112]KNZ74617.1 hypothetical protein J132_06571 [Termitomyces sp. J132]
MQSKREVIDVDKPLFYDLTKENDLTDNDIQELSPSRISRPPPQRTKVSHRSNFTLFPSTVKRFGPPSSINIRTALSQLPSRAQSPIKKLKVGSDSIIVIEDEDDLTPLNRPQQTQSKVGGTKRAFELDSDGEDVETKPKKKKKQQEDDETDEEDAYARCHAGYDINNEDIWKPAKVNQAKLTFDIPDSPDYLFASNQLSHFNLKPRRRQPDFSSPYPYPFTKLPEWKPLRRYIVPPPPRLIGYSLPTKLRRGSRQRIVQPLKQFTSFKHAPGSINHIEQSGPWIAIASAATGGHPDDAAIGDIDPYNREGSIMVWNGKPEILPGHFRQKNMQGVAEAVSLQPSKKYYTVNDVKFDPCSSSLVSAGNDKNVHIWRLDDETNTYEKDDRIPFAYPPIGLAFRPDTSRSVISVAERSLHLISDIADSPVEMQALSLSGQKKKDFYVGAMTWGRDLTANHLFASSEPLDSTKFIGHHKAIDTEKWKILYAFREDGAGDEITVTKDGSRLALITRREDHIHPLHIYDVRRSNPEITASIELPSFPSNIEGEVTSASFSSDGIYLAMGRNDNCIHVYDSRFLDRLLFEYQHHGLPKTHPGNHSYGVVKVQWVDEDSVLPFGLVTGGNDGCVRFWNPQQADSNLHNGSILAEISSDVATFSIGNRYKGEHSIVVGDGSGEVAIFDFAPQGYHSIYR